MKNNLLEIPKKSFILRFGLSFLVLVCLVIVVMTGKYLITEDPISFNVLSFFLSILLIYILSSLFIKKPFASKSTSGIAHFVRMALNGLITLITCIGLIYYILNLLAPSVLIPFVSSLNLSSDVIFPISVLFFLLLIVLEISFGKRDRKIHFSLLLWSILLSASFFLLPIVIQG